MSAPTVATLACVLRSGGEYRPEHVTALYRGIMRHWPTEVMAPRFLCFTDMKVTQYGVTVVPLVSRWPGWWAKMEILRRDVPGTLLYVDLDCVVTGDLSPLAEIERLTVLRDFYRPKGLQTALMVLPEAERWEAWDAFLAAPDAIMDKHRSDQEWLEGRWLGKADRMQDVVGGIYGYKTDVKGKGVPKDARLLMFHGKPRPWDTDLWPARAA